MSFLKNDPEIGKYLNLLFRVGLFMVLSILFFFFTGLFIYRHLYQNAGILIGFILMGVGCGFYFIFRELKKLD